MHTVAAVIANRRVTATTIVTTLETSGRLRDRRKSITFHPEWRWIHLLGRDQLRSEADEIRSLFEIIAAARRTGNTQRQFALHYMQTNLVLRVWDIRNNHSLVRFFSGNYSIYDSKSTFRWPKSMMHSLMERFISRKHAFLALYVFNSRT